MYESFSRIGFFIFKKDEYSDVTKLLTSLNLHRIVTVRTLSRGNPYMIAEIDYRAYEMLCRNNCMRDHVLDERCYLECKEAKKLEALKEILNKLETNGV